MGEREKLSQEDDIRNGKRKAEEVDALLFAWNFGSPLSRTTIFVSITTSIFTPLPDLSRSPSHLKKIKDRAPSRCANGVTFLCLQVTRLDSQRIKSYQARVLRYQ